jgi:hypothetical protein
LFEVTEEFVQNYNRTAPDERNQLNERVKRMLQRLKVSQIVKSTDDRTIHSIETSQSMSSTYRSTEPFAHDLVEIFDAN